MIQPDLFPSSISIGPRAYHPKPTPAGCVRLLGRCRVKNCKTCRAIDVPLVERPSSYGSGTYQTPDPDKLSAARERAKCPDHPAKVLEFERIEGTQSDKHECDPRCMMATGPVCVCSCGGANHSGGWL